MEQRLAWYVVGPLIGLLVAGLFALANKPLGASGAYVQTASLLRRRQVVEVWRIWYFGGIVVGAAVASWALGGFAPRLGYEPLRGVLGTPLVVGVLFLAGTAMGYGARVAGGCTSGHGLCGTASRSPASFATIAVIMGTAIAVTLTLHALTGGAW